ncbi:hypothetical protein V6N12_024050 [Hibiscus sabdariffa]|uniref:Uncharacterized protein n=1 Tax=Hibiscus sabdariffa TaxID=183260 RepID=A0ABR2FZN5_9ROSI
MRDTTSEYCAMVWIDNRFWEEMGIHVHELVIIWLRDFALAGYGECMINTLGVDEVLESGLYLNSSIRVHVDRWGSSPVEFSIPYIDKPSSLVLCYEFMLLGQASWDERKVCSAFHLADANAVLRVMIAPSRGDIII